MGFKWGAQTGTQRIGLRMHEGSVGPRIMAACVFAAFLALSIAAATYKESRDYLLAGFTGTHIENEAGRGEFLRASDFTADGTLDLDILTATRSPSLAVFERLDSGDMSWMMVSTAFVLLMTPGLAFFYGGMVKSKNTISTIMQSFITMGIITVIWIFVGFSLSFGEDLQYGFTTGPDPACPLTDFPPIGDNPYFPSCQRNKGGILGNPKTYYFFKDVGAAPNEELAPTIPNLLYALFQLMFAVITPALITGGFAERVKFSSLAFFIVLWHFIVYCPLAHSVWHFNGILRRFGTLDFAGGTVVHMSSGYAAVAGVWFLGPRKNSSHAPPANVPFVVLGTALLWFGWFGFNAGSALAANVVAVNAFCNTNTAGAAGMCAWLLIDVMRGYKARATGACAGAVVGFVVITPAAGFVDVGAALVMGIIGATVSHTLVHWVKETKFDDTLDAWSCHGAGGTLGTILTGLFATKKACPENLGGLDGGWHGNGTLFWHHIVLVLIVIPIIIGLSLICYQITDLILPMRVEEVHEHLGLDQSQHGEKAGLHLDEEEIIAKLNASMHGSVLGEFSLSRAASTEQLNSAISGLGGHENLKTAVSGLNVNDKARAPSRFRPSSVSPEPALPFAGQQTDPSQLGLPLPAAVAAAAGSRPGSGSQVWPTVQRAADSEDR